MKKQKVGLRSMTGYGSAAGERVGLLLEVEVKTVNSRFLDLVFRLPRSYLSQELMLREKLSEVFTRGRIEVYVNRTPIAADRCPVQINRVVFDAFWKEQLALAASLNLDSPDLQNRLFSELLSRREIVNSDKEGEVEKEEAAFLVEMLMKAANKALAMRELEGERIQVDLVSRLGLLKALENQIESLASQVPAAFQQRLIERVGKLLCEAGDTSVDEGRLAQEVALLADRCDVAEELTRLKSHFSQFEEIIAGKPEGRKLQFLLQEIVREFNTISSKAQLAEVQQFVVEAKSEAERLREQVQNVE